MARSLTNKKTCQSSDIILKKQRGVGHCHTAGCEVRATAPHLGASTTIFITHAGCQAKILH